MQLTQGEHFIDSLTIIPSTVSVFDDETGTLLPKNAYQVTTHGLIWKRAPQRVNLRYRVFAFNLDQSFSHLDTSRIRTAADGSYIGFDYNPYDPQQGVIDFKGLDYNGSFARGISFGNNQNLVLNSSFNLQLSGKLGDDIEILAAITDNNIPLQPEGNTQQLQEFDKIFIQLKRGNSSLIAGDYELSRPDGYFMNYFKKLQGATFSNKSEILSKGILRSKASIAIARGKFARNTLPIQEGNQGPYKLRGQEGERFIIVLAGTEKVYVDGQLMTRGLEEDYVIDYDQGNINFTNRRLVTKDIRVIVEFEYSDQNYTRSLVAINTDYTYDKLQVYFNLFSQQDGKSSGGAQDLSPEEKKALADAGDDLDNAFASGLDTLEEFSEFRVKYKLVDSLGYDSILVFSTNPDSARFVANFLLVGEGQGNYVQIPSAANGRVYKWVKPDDDNQPQGNYEPIVKLSAPSKQQMYTVGARYAFSKNSTIQTELAMSNSDLNRFSDLNSDDNVGYALFSQYEFKKKLGKKEKDWEIQTGLQYEFVDRNFKNINPYRAAEFTRDWNIDQVNVTQKANLNEHLAQATVKINRGRKSSLEYGFGTFLRDTLYTGTKHSSRLIYQDKGFQVNAQMSLLAAQTPDEESQFFRPNLDISKSFSRLGNWKVGLYGEEEKNSRRSLRADTLLQSSFYYDLYRVYLRSPEQENFSFNVQYGQRYDYFPVGNAFQQNTLADEFNLNGNWRQSSASNLRWNLTYRQLKIEDPELTNQQAQATYLGRTEYSLQLFKGTIRSSTVYEIGSGQEPKIEYQYLPVNAGDGAYYWDLSRDLNGDSIPQVNEFEIANFQDQGNFARVSIFTDEFIRTNNVQFNQSLSLNPKKIWNQKKGFARLLSKFSTQSTLRITRRTRESDEIAPWNPFQLSIADTALVSVSSNIRNVLYLNRASPVYDVQIGMFDNSNKNVLTTGFESKRISEQFLRARWNFNRQFSTQLNLVKGRRENDSEFFNNRDYQLNFYEVEPQFTYLRNQNFRVILSYLFKNSKNQLLENGEQASQHDFKTEFTYNQSTNTAIRLKLSYVDIQYTGEPNTPISYAMLAGLQNGKNYLWTLSFDRQLAKNIQLNLSYEGRKTGEARVIHVGRAQIRASF